MCKSSPQQQCAQYFFLIKLSCFANKGKDSRPETEKVRNYLEGIHKILSLSAFSEENTKSLDYGVMVAQQVLVLFVEVRILVVQQFPIKEKP